MAFQLLLCSALLLLGHVDAYSCRSSRTRRWFIAQGPAAAAVVAARPRASHAITVDAAREQWTKAIAKIAELDEAFDSVAKGGGDAVRVELGTAGSASPLYQIDKALDKLLPEASDPAEFGEQLDLFIYRLRQADGMAYSANFAGGSGKPKPPAVYLQLSHDEVAAMRALSKKLDAAL